LFAAMPPRHYFRQMFITRAYAITPLRHMPLDAAEIDTLRRCFLSAASSL